MKPTLDVEQRRAAILNLLNQDGQVQVESLSEFFDISAVTIRKDLRELELRGLCKRTYGGAKATSAPSSLTVPYEPPFNYRKKLMEREKQAIAHYASELIRPGDSIALDSSTSCFALTPFLRSIHALNIFTNSLLIAQQFIDVPNIKVQMPAGRLRRESVSLVGDLDTSKRINFTWGFFGVRGITWTRGMTDVNQEESDFKRTLFQQCERPVILVDSSKWGFTATYTFADANSPYQIITSHHAPAEYVMPFIESKQRVAQVPLS